MTPARTLYDQLAHAAERFGDAEFLVVGRRTETLTFRALKEQADVFGRMLAEMGVAPGDRVALWMTNRADWAIAAYGVARCGGVLVGLNTRLVVREVAQMLELTRPRVWLLEEDFLGKRPAADWIAPVLEALRERGAPLPQVVGHADLLVVVAAQLLVIVIFQRPYHALHRLVARHEDKAQLGEQR